MKREQLIVIIQRKPMLLCGYSLIYLILLHSLMLSTTAMEPYIVYLGAHPHEKEPMLIDLEHVRKSSHHKLLASYVGSAAEAKERIIYSYTKNINGFAANLEAEEAAFIAKDKRVKSIFLNKRLKMHTTRSWDFLGLGEQGSGPNSTTWKTTRFGENVIIGFIDSGIFPESPSFNDKGITSIPQKWRGRCQQGRGSPVPCNNKVIGVRFYSKGLAATYNVTLDESYETARDTIGHGTHTASTAAGDFVYNASAFNFGNGIASGGAPKARLAIYRVAWTLKNNGTNIIAISDADALAAFDDAISDGVDVISVSLGFDLTTDYFMDPIAIGAFHAISKGITVVASAGNSGPTPMSIANVAPWIITVGANTMDRAFVTTLKTGIINLNLKGQSLSQHNLPRRFFPLIAADKAKAPKASSINAMHCMPRSLDPKKAQGKIVICMRGENARVEKGFVAHSAEAVGMVLINDLASGNDAVADPHLLPAIHLNYTNGQALLAYVKSTKHPTGYITPVATKLGVKPAPILASFSSRGPNPMTTAILKPDVIAPGMSVIAAFTNETSPTAMDFDARRVPFNVMSGTSMSCPHISGIVALLKAVHSDWSPAAIRSAIMTTATMLDNTGNPILDASTSLEATPFDYGAGHAQPKEALEPGLVYDLGMQDYLDFLCAQGYNETQLEDFGVKNYKCPFKPASQIIENMNYPSITVVDLNVTRTVSRTLKNVGCMSNYVANIIEPMGTQVVITPKRLDFAKVGQQRTFKLTIKNNGMKTNYGFGLLTWSDGTHSVKSPIVVYNALQ